MWCIAVPNKSLSRGATTIERRESHLHGHCISQKSFCLALGLCPQQKTIVAFPQQSVPWNLQARTA